MANSHCMANLSKGGRVKEGGGGNITYSCVY